MPRFVVVAAGIVVCVLALLVTAVIIWPTNQSGGTIVPPARSEAELKWGQDYQSRTVDPSTTRLNFRERDPRMAGTIALEFPRSYVTWFMVGPAPDRDLLFVVLSVVYPGMEAFTLNEEKLKASPWSPPEKKRADEIALYQRRLLVHGSHNRYTPDSYANKPVPAECRYDRIDEFTYKIEPWRPEKSDYACSRFQRLNRSVFLITDENGIVAAHMACLAEDKKLPRQLECDVNFNFDGWRWRFSMKANLIPSVRDVLSNVKAFLSLHRLPSGAQ